MTWDGGIGGGSRWPLLRLREGNVMKKVLICSAVFILVAVAYMAGHNSGYEKGRETGREIGFREGWEASEKDATVDWDEWR